MKPVLHSSQNQTEIHPTKENFSPNLLNIDAKILNLKKWQIECNNISEKSFTMIKLVSSQGFRDGSRYANQ
jgi:hypothetical protein